MPFRENIKLLGVSFDEALTMDRRVNELILSCNYYTRAVRRIRALMSDTRRRQYDRSPHRDSSIIRQRYRASFTGCQYVKGFIYRRLS